MRSGQNLIAMADKDGACWTNWICGRRDVCSARTPPQLISPTARPWGANLTYPTFCAQTWLANMQPDLSSSCGHKTKAPKLLSVRENSRNSARRCATIKADRNRARMKRVEIQVLIAKQLTKSWMSTKWSYLPKKDAATYYNPGAPPVSIHLFLGWSRKLKPLNY